MRIYPLLLALPAFLPACTATLEEDLSALTQRVSQLEDQLDDSEADQAAAEAELQETLDALADGLASLEGEGEAGRYLHTCEGDSTYEIDWGVTFTEETLGGVTIWMYGNSEWIDWFQGSTAIQHGWNAIEPDLTVDGGVYTRCLYDDIGFEDFRTEKFLLIVD
ncbi:MAG: hypothetical protein AAFV53_35275 [Myxococcota bacterium]